MKHTELLPIGKDDESIRLADDISRMLMEFVVHNQKPYSKSLQEFIAIGMHDVRAGLIAGDIIVRVQRYLDIKKD